MTKFFPNLPGSSYFYSLHTRSLPFSCRYPHPIFLIYFCLTHSVKNCINLTTQFLFYNLSWCVLLEPSRQCTKKLAILSLNMPSPQPDPLLSPTFLLQQLSKPFCNLFKASFHCLLTFHINVINRLTVVFFFGWLIFFLFWYH